MNISIIYYLVHFLSVAVHNKWTRSNVTVLLAIVTSYNSCLSSCRALKFSIGYYTHISVTVYSIYIVENSELVKNDKRSSPGQFTVLPWNLSCRCNKNHKYYHSQ